MRVWLPGYHCQHRLLEDVSTAIYRGQRDRDGASVLVKSLKTEYPTQEENARLQAEYNLLKSLGAAGIVKPIKLENYRHRLALILEDVPGKTLKYFIRDRQQGGVDLSHPEFIPTFLKSAIQIATILGYLHDRQIVHQDIKPENFLIDPETREITLINFSIAAQVSQQRPTPDNAIAIAGTLAYMSPEQTGRTNRQVDYRSDLYSFGITCYEILTGQLPFNTSDPLALIHSHIAKTPISPDRVSSAANPTGERGVIPQTISDMVMKLLAKTPEERYQSSYGIKSDLELCLHQLYETGKIQPFTPGTLDRSGQFSIPEKLYGRETEIGQLTEAVHRVGGGSTEMALVLGYSDIGKTRPIREIHPVILDQNAYFIGGKFHQYQGQVPYAAFIQAFQELIHQLLSDRAARIEEWKGKLIAALGENAGVIAEVIPEVEWMVGEMPAVPSLPPTEAQNRFHRVFQQFIGVFRKQEHPLVLFLDDLQWVDAASLNSIERLMSDRNGGYLLTIAAYRHNEIHDTHPWRETLQRIQHSEARVEKITLSPLNRENVCALVRDTVHTEESADLAELVFEKTAGNPFFIAQLLKSLHQKGLIGFDFAAQQWRWDLEGIKQAAIADNDISLTRDRIQSLSASGQTLLKQAACIGVKFSLQLLAEAVETSLSATARELSAPLEAGLIVPLKEGENLPVKLQENAPHLTPWERENEPAAIAYQFVHDRVQQAAYSLIPEAQKPQMHLNVGQLLRDRTPDGELSERIFPIVNQFNLGISAISDANRKLELASLNAIAGQKAKSASAYESAAKYLRAGLQLLPEHAWETHYSLTLTLHGEAAAAEYLNTNFQEAEALADVVLNRARSLLDKVQIYETQIQYYIAQNHLAQAIQIGVSVLEMLGVSLPESPTPEQIDRAAVQMESAWTVEGIKDLAALPEMTDAYQLAALRILMNITAPAYIVNPALMPLIVLTMVNLCIESGNSALAA